MDSAAEAQDKIHAARQALGEAHRIFAEKGRAYAQAESSFRAAHGSALLKAAVPTEGEHRPPEDLRRAKADVETADLRFIRDLAEQECQQALELVRSRRTALTAVMSVVSAFKEEAYATKYQPKGMKEEG